MNPEILPVIREIIERFGADTFANMHRANAMLLDLAPGMPRERILARNLVELGGCRALLNAGGDYPLVKQNLIKNLTETFCLEASAAAWVVQLFALALGRESEALPEVTAATGAAMPERGAWVAVGKAHAAAAAADGTVFAGGDNTHFQCDVQGWRNVVAVAAGDAHTIGLRADGTLCAAGSSVFDQCDVTAGSNVAKVYAFGDDTVCVHINGGVTAMGRTKFDLAAFSGIVSVARCPDGLLGIREDGRVVASFTEADEDLAWVLAQEDVAQVIATYVNGCIVLKKDGRIYKSGRAENYFSPWREVEAIVDLSDSFALLRKDGSVRILPYEREQTRKPNPSDTWGGIVGLYGRYKRLVGLTREGRLLSACTDAEWQKRNPRLDFVTQWYPVGGIS